MSVGTVYCCVKLTSKPNVCVHGLVHRMASCHHKEDCRAIRFDKPVCQSLIEGEVTLTKRGLRL